MKPEKGYYSIIQYCPDLSLHEAANIGVLLFCPESGFLNCLTSRNNSRIIRFFGQDGHDWKRISTVKKALQDRLKVEREHIQTVEQLEQFIATRANMLQISPPRTMRVEDPEKDLAGLFERVLGQPAKPTRKRDFRRMVGRQLEVAGLQRKIVPDVVVNVPVLGKSVEIPYGFQNGRFNLISPVRFQAANPDQSVNTACKYAVEGRSLFEHPHDRFGDLQLVVVGQFRAKDNESRERVGRVLKESNVKFYAAEQLPKLIEEIRQTAKDVVSA